jgi:molecular chaperone GrpE
MTSPQPTFTEPPEPVAEAPAPEPATPEPAIPEPAIPEPAIPEPAIPEPVIPEPVPVDACAEALRAVHDELARGNDRAAARERVIERLHEENQVLKAGERQSLLRPVVTDLYRLRDDLLQQAGELPPDFGAERAAALLRSYAQTVELALERAGVLPERPAVGDPFDARAHRAAAVVAAAGPAADATVAGILRDGYRDTVTDRVLVPATVRVARWTDRP